MSCGGDSLINISYRPFNDKVTCVCATISIFNYEFDIVAYMFDECLIIYMIHVSFEG